MKYRKSFVTNSSSSSYICDVCGRHEEGWDMCLSEAEMMECENGHTICEDEIIEDIIYLELLKEFLVEDSKDELDITEIDEDEARDICYDRYELRYYLPEKYCPICNFLACSESDMVQYLLNTREISKDEVFAEVKKVNKRRKKLYDSEYIQYVCKKFDLAENQLIDEIKNKFGTYREFKNFLRR